MNRQGNSRVAKEDFMISVKQCRDSTEWFATADVLNKIRKKEQKFAR